MYKHTSFVFSLILIGNIATSIFPSMAQAQVLVAQRTSSSELKQLLNEGHRLIDVGDYNGAISIYQQAATIQPKNASIYSGIGFSYIRLGNFPAALASFRRAVELEPNNANYQYALGYVSGTLNDYPTAKEAYRRAIQANRGNVEAYIGLATILLRLGERNNAMWAYGEAAKLDPRNPLVSQFKNNTVMQQRQF
jgi:Flp pilus assembly protein TadD